MKCESCKWWDGRPIYNPDDPMVPLYEAEKRMGLCKNLVMLSREFIVRRIIRFDQSCDHFEAKHEN